MAGRKVNGGEEANGSPSGAGLVSLLPPPLWFVLSQYKGEFYGVLKGDQSPQLMRLFRS